MYYWRMKLDPMQLIDDFVWGDVLEKYGLFGRLGASLLRYLWAIARDFFSGQLTLRAMSLVYTTLLSVVSEPFQPRSQLLWYLASPACRPHYDPQL